MSKVTLITGADIGDAQENIESVTSFIEKQIGRIVLSSSIHTSIPWGFEANTIFYNQVLICETNLTPEEVLKEIWIIESLFGRVRSEERYASRTMDIDILFYDHQIISTKLLTIPHKLIEARNFVLEPLSEIMGSFIHPVLNKSIDTLKTELQENE
ncbi:MAG: 2-amino-4-hydroxy-6-hydroxymethyldihydropteridine diphosphokinase [Rikenellaceae bacterium]